MTSLFSQDLLDKSIFKWEDLAGKELLIKVGHYPDELGKGMHVCVVGVDKTSGKCYVLHTGVERGGRLNYLTCTYIRNHDGMNECSYHCYSFEEK